MVVRLQTFDCALGSDCIKDISSAELASLNQIALTGMSMQQLLTRGCGRCNVWPHTQPLSLGCSDATHTCRQMHSFNNPVCK